MSGGAGVARILALDIGTSSAKGILFDATGAPCGSHGVGYPLESPSPGYAEQDPDRILAAVRDVIDTLAPTGTDLSLCCAMHSWIGVDERGRPLTRMWTWADQRSAEVAAELRSGPDAAGLHTRTGTPIHPMSPLCKTRYLRRSDPDCFARIARFVSIKEYVLEALTGSRCVDHSVASSTGMFRLEALDWDERALELAGIDESRLSTPVPTRHVLEDEAGDRRIVLGATDGVFANVGAAGDDQGASESPVLCLTLGTSGAARLTVDRIRTDPAGRLFCYVLDEDRFVIGGAINNGGLVLRWLKQAVGAGDDSMEDLLELAASAPAGADGVLCIPELTGERYPSYGPSAGGTFRGLTLRHGRSHLLRAGVEGMMFAFLPLVDELEETGGRGRLREVRVGGGVFAEAFCRQLLADILGRRVVMTSSEESSALGAARFGFQTLGEATDWPLEFPHTHEPDAAAHRVYQEVAENRRRWLAGKR